MSLGVRKKLEVNVTIGAMIGAMIVGEMIVGEMIVSPAIIATESVTIMIEIRVTIVLLLLLLLLRHRRLCQEDIQIPQLETLELSLLHN